MSGQIVFILGMAGIMTVVAGARVGLLVLLLSSFAVFVVELVTR